MVARMYFEASDRSATSFFVRTSCATVVCGSFGKVLISTFVPVLAVFMCKGGVALGATTGKLEASPIRLEERETMLTGLCANIRAPIAEEQSSRLHRRVGG